MRMGIGFDTHRLVEGRKLILGGVDIPHETGLLGHSDADVLTHAIMDALLGAIADGDIGQHFPDTDPKWAGADSIALLRAVVARLADQGWRVGNVEARSPSRPRPSKASAPSAAAKASPPSPPPPSSRSRESLRPYCPRCFQRTYRDARVGHGSEARCAER